MAPPKVFGRFSAALSSASIALKLGGYTFLLRSLWNAGSRDTSEV